MAARHRDATISRRSTDRWAVIAGASEGVGASLADQLAERGLDLVLIARNAAKLLDELAAGVRERHGVEVDRWCQDLTDPDVGERVGRGDRRA